MGAEGRRHHAADEAALDQIAARFLADATDFWRVCDSNNAMSPDALAARNLVGIPIYAQVSS